MKKIVAFAALLACCAAWADLAKVSVTWTRPNIYVTAEGAYIRTAGCDRLTINEDAVLRYFEGADALTFADGSVCQVLEVYK